VVSAAELGRRNIMTVATSSFSFPGITLPHDLTHILAQYTAVVIIAAFLAYFLPTFVGFLRGRANMAQVIIINLFLGWSGIGWIVALAMAFGSTKKQLRGR
jgi:hypothetical protein